MSRRFCHPPASDSRCLVAISRQIPLTEPPPEASSSSPASIYCRKQGKVGQGQRAARRGSLDRLPAFGTFAGAMDGKAGDSGYLHQERFLLYTEKIFTFPMVS